MMLVNRKAFAEEMMLDEETIRELYGYFSEELAQEACELTTAHEQSDNAWYGRVIHKIKGTSASYHAERLVEQVTRADACIKRGDSEAARALFHGIMEATEAVLEEIRSWT